MNFAKFLRTPFLKKTPSGDWLRDLKSGSEICHLNIFLTHLVVETMTVFERIPFRMSRVKKNFQNKYFF